MLLSILKAVGVSSIILLQLCKLQFFEVVDGLPKGKKSIGYWAKFSKGFLGKSLANFTKIPSKF